MLSNLRTHKYQALILDSPVLQYFAAQVRERQGKSGRRQYRQDKAGQRDAQHVTPLSHTPTNTLSHTVQAAECDLYVVGDAFETFNLAIAFPPDAPDSLPAAVSASIVRLQVSEGL